VAEAKKLLKRKVTAIEAGKVIPREDKVTFESFAKDLENDYRVNTKRSLAIYPTALGILGNFSVWTVL
jgi:hypothetical protein